MSYLVHRTKVGWVTQRMRSTVEVRVVAVMFERSDTQSKEVSKMKLGSKVDKVIRWNQRTAAVRVVIEMT